MARFNAVRRVWRPAGLVVNAAEEGRPEPLAFPKTQPENQFDFTNVATALAPGTTVTQAIFTAEEGFKAGVIAGLGLGFNVPWGYRQVRIHILVNGGLPSNYLFRHFVDAVTWQGSLPPFSIGSIEEMASVRIPFPANARLEIRFQNLSGETTFVCAIRFWGWFFGD